MKKSLRIATASLTGVLVFGATGAVAWWDHETPVPQFSPGPRVPVSNTCKQLTPGRHWPALVHPRSPAWVRARMSILSPNMRQILVMRRAW